MLYLDGDSEMETGKTADRDMDDTQQRAGI